MISGSARPPALGFKAGWINDDSATLDGHFQIADGSGIKYDNGRFLVLIRRIRR
jgi:hypothetical protein